MKRQKNITSSASNVTKEVVLCKHCGKPIHKTALIGLSLICPLCGKPQNGHQKKDNDNTHHETTLLCKHCDERIKTSVLLGFSLLCPMCGKPQNGVLHEPVTKTAST